MLAKNSIKTKFAIKNRGTILPIQTALWINYLISVIIFAFASLFFILLIPYNPEDNCWFKVSNSLIITNKLGFIGAYLADFILSIFGFTGWWLLFGLFCLGYRKIIRNKIETDDWYTILQLIVFLILVISSSIFEFIWFYNAKTNYLHNGFGGLFGKYSDILLGRYTGQLVVAIACSVLMIVCFFFSFEISIISLNSFKVLNNLNNFLASLIESYNNLVKFITK